MAASTGVRCSRACCRSPSSGVRSLVSRIATIAGLLVGAAALVLQFALTIPARLEAGDMIFGAVIFYFTFFTILTNLALVLIYAAELWPQTGLSWFRRPV